MLEDWPQDDLVYDKTADLSEVSDERPRVNVGPVISLSMTSYDILAASFVQNSLPSTEELDTLCSKTGLKMSEVRWFFLKVKHLVQQEDGCQSGDTLYLETLKFIYNNVNENGDEIMIL